MINIDEAINNPESIFKSPDEVVSCKDLTREQKIKILKHWEYDARLLEVAEEENMRGNDLDILDLILLALKTLDEPTCQEHSAPTKTGGE